MSDHLKVFLHVPAIFLRGGLTASRAWAEDEIREVIQYINSEAKDLGYGYADITWFDPVSCNWDESWVKEVNSSDIHIYYMPQNFKDIGIGYFNNYEKYSHSIPQSIIYRRKMDGWLNTYSIRGIEEHKTTTLTHYGIFIWGERNNIGHIISTFKPNQPTNPCAEITLGDPYEGLVKQTHEGISRTLKYNEGQGVREFFTLVIHQ